MRSGSKVGGGSKSRKFSEAKQSQTMRSLPEFKTGKIMFMHSISQTGQISVGPARRGRLWQECVLSRNDGKAPTCDASFKSLLITITSHESKSANSLKSETGPDTG